MAFWVPFTIGLTAAATAATGIMQSQAADRQAAAARGAGAAPGAQKHPARL